LSGRLIYRQPQPFGIQTIVGYLITSALTCLVNMDCLKRGRIDGHVSVFSQQDAAIVRLIFPSAIEFDPGLLDGSLLMFRFAHELRDMTAAGLKPPAGSAHAIAQHMLSRKWSDRHLRRLTENLETRMFIEFVHKTHHLEPLSGVYDLLMQMGQLLSS
jgi:hypothetical protein